LPGKKRNIKSGTVEPKPKYSSPKKKRSEPRREDNPLANEPPIKADASLSLQN
jgi:hypothetical protein